MENRTKVGTQEGNKQEGVLLRQQRAAQDIHWRR